MTENQKVFVYGTLLSGEGNNYLLENSQLLGDEKVAGLTMHSLGPYPACVVDTTNEKGVIGEVWEVDAETMHNLDWLEGYPSFYNRVEVDTKFGKAWVYVHNKAPMRPVIESGDWKAYTGKVV